MKRRIAAHRIGQVDLEPLLDSLHARVVQRDLPGELTLGSDGLEWLHNPKSKIQNPKWRQVVNSKANRSVAAVRLPLEAVTMATVPLMGVVVGLAGSGQA